jgi:hypothetical protein
MAPGLYNNGVGTYFLNKFTTNLNNASKNVKNVGKQSSGNKQMEKPGITTPQNVWIKNNIK